MDELKNVIPASEGWYVFIANPNLESGSSPTFRFPIALWMVFEHTDTHEETGELQKGWTAKPVVSVGPQLVDGSQLPHYIGIHAPHEPLQEFVRIAKEMRNAMRTAPPPDDDDSEPVLRLAPPPNRKE